MMKNKIEIGSRWRSVGRNLPSYEGVVKMVTHKNDFIYLLRDGDDMSAPYDKYFFLANFEPIKDETVRDFKVGDLVEVNFKGTIETVLDNTAIVKHEIEAMNFQTTFRNLTLLESAKPDLVVGQVFYDRNNEKTEVCFVRDGHVCLWFQRAGKFGVCSVEEYQNRYAHKLVVENESKTKTGIS
jgi:hypothetical protein